MSNKGIKNMLPGNTNQDFYLQTSCQHPCRSSLIGSTPAAIRVLAIQDGLHPHVVQYSPTSCTPFRNIIRNLGSALRGCFLLRFFSEQSRMDKRKEGNVIKVFLGLYCFGILFCLMAVQLKGLDFFRTGS